MVQLDHIGQKCFDMAVKVNHFHLEQKPLGSGIFPFFNPSLFMEQGRGSESPSMDVEVNHLHLFQSQN